jgi:ribosomal protein S18 acetylase RimI-like enzyme
MNRKHRLEIVGLSLKLVEPLADLFAEIKNSEIEAFFHPHPFTRSEAERLCNYTGEDLYYAVIFGSKILGYGMLRGWDEGYSMPSLGILIKTEMRGQGIGKLLILHLHAAARLRGAEQIRLKVYQANSIAIKMYEELGYIFEEKENDQLVGFYDLIRV